VRPVAPRAGRWHRLQRWLYRAGWGETPEETVAAGVAEIERITAGWPASGNVIADTVRGVDRSEDA
jgi:hypothetical protein